MSESDKLELATLGELPPQKLIAAEGRPFRYLRATLWTDKLIMIGTRQRMWGKEVHSLEIHPSKVQALAFHQAGNAIVRLLFGLSLMSLVVAFFQPISSVFIATAILTLVTGVMSLQRELCLEVVTEAQSFSFLIDRSRKVEAELFAEKLLVESERAREEKSWA